ncbi:immunity 22 family protein [Clostridium neuense]|uniref:Immunity 22 family protein n=1 Tax=Clostridium neuense TaxID=1728934 RepID=A0ABW8TNG4_9CLOT
MEKNGVVSLWLGNIETEEFLKNYVDLRYTDNGDWEASQFLNDFNIDMDDIEEDFIEKVLYTEANDDVDKLLSGCSYEDIVIPNIKKIIINKLEDKFNAVILVYNFEYNGEESFINNEVYKMKYIGSVQYT